MAVDIQFGVHMVDVLACSPFSRASGHFDMFDEQTEDCCPVLQPGSPQLADVRCHQYACVPSRMDSDIKLLSGSKRSCEGFNSLQDEAEADDSSMVSCRGSQMMCRSGSVRSFGIKRVCSIASADGIDSHCQLQQLQSGMIPVPGSSGNLQQTAAETATAAVHSYGCDLSPGRAAAPIPVPGKRSSKTGSSSFSSQEHACSLPPAGQEAASVGKLAPVRTSAPRGPRLRLGGKLLSPEEAQKHLQAVAAAAAAATAGRSLSRAQSPAVICPSRDLPAGPQSSSMTSAGGPSTSAGNSSGFSGPSSKPPAASLAVSARPAAALRRAGPCLDALPENFIPTPEGVCCGNTLASTLDEDPCGATSRGCGSPLVCSSHTELLLGEEGTHVLPAADMNGAASTAPVGPSDVSAFAGPSVEPWPIQQQQQLMPLHLASAGSFNAPHQGVVGLSSSVPVHIPAHNMWPSSALLSKSVSGSNGSSGSGNTLADSLSGEGSAPGQFDSPAASDTMAGGGLAQLLDSWAPEQQLPQAHAQQAPAVVSFMSGSVGISNGSVGPAGPWNAPASAPAGSPATAAASGGSSAAWTPAFGQAATHIVSAGVGSTGAMLNAGMQAPVVPVCVDALQQLPVQLPRVKVTTANRNKRQSKQAGSKHKQQHTQQDRPQPPVQIPTQLPQMLVMAEGSQPVVLSQQELMGVLQQNMAASFASGYLMAQQQQQQTQPQLLKPVATLGPFVMPAAASPAAQPAGSAAAAAPPASLALLMHPAPAGAPGLNVSAGTTATGSDDGEVAPLVLAHGVDDILPSLQELLTDCC